MTINDLCAALRSVFDPSVITETQLKDTYGYTSHSDDGSYATWPLLEQAFFGLVNQILKSENSLDPQALANVAYNMGLDFIALVELERKEASWPERKRTAISSLNEALEVTLYRLFLKMMDFLEADYFNAINPDAQKRYAQWSYAILFKMQAEFHWALYELSNDISDLESCNMAYDKLTARSFDLSFDKKEKFVELFISQAFVLRTFITMGRIEYMVRFQELTEKTYALAGSAGNSDRHYEMQKEVMLLYAQCFRFMCENKFGITRDFLIQYRDFFNAAIKNNIMSADVTRTRKSQELFQLTGRGDVGDSALVVSQPTEAMFQMPSHPQSASNCAEGKAQIRGASVSQAYWILDAIIQSSDPYKILPKFHAFASKEDIAAVHDPAYVELLSTAPSLKVSDSVQLPPVPLDPSCETFLGLSTWQAALDAVSQIGFALQYAKTNNKTILCFGGPPGHHAGVSDINGFCPINKAAVGAYFAMKSDETLKNNMVWVDFDVHSGQGSADICQHSPALAGMKLLNLFRANHFPDHTPPGQEWLGDRVLNVSISEKRKKHQPNFRTRFREQFNQGLNDLLKTNKPSVWMVSFGLDGHKKEDKDIGGWKLETRDYVWMLQVLRNISAPIVLVSEGGYSEEVYHSVLPAVMRLIAQVEASYPADSLHTHSAFQDFSVDGLSLYNSKMQSHSKELASSERSQLSSPTSSVGVSSTGTTYSQFERRYNESTTIIPSRYRVMEWPGGSDDERDFPFETGGEVRPQKRAKVQLFQTQESPSTVASASQGAGVSRPPSGSW